MYTREQIQELHIRANHLEPLALEALGIAYQDPNSGIKNDLNRAIFYLRAAVFEGNANAAFPLARIFCNNALKGKQGAELYCMAYARKGADMGNVDCMYMLALIFIDGIATIQKNSVLAFEWFHEAACHGHLESMKQTTYMYYEGKGTDRNVEGACYWAEQAASLGDVLAMLWAGIINDSLRKYNQAVYWFQKAAECGNEEARGKLGRYKYSNLKDKWVKR